MTINIISIELCSHAISNLMSTYLLLFDPVAHYTLCRDFSHFFLKTTISVISETIYSMGVFENFLSAEWNSIRQGGPVYGIVTKTVHKTVTRRLEGSPVFIRGV